MILLEHLRSMAPQLGTNLRADVEVANWLHLLPSPVVGRVAVVGAVDAGVVDALRELGATVTDGGPVDLVVVGDGWDGAVPAAPARFRAGAAEEGAAWLVPARGGAPPLVEGPSQLVVPFRPVPPSRTLHPAVRARRVLERGLRRAGVGGRMADRAERTGTLAVQPAPPAEGEVVGGTLSLPGPAGLLPAYVRDAAVEGGLGPDVARARWTFLAQGNYRSQKVVFFTSSGGEDVVVKVSRSARFSPKLRNEQASLQVLAGSPFAASVPAPRFAVDHRGLAVTGQVRAAGSPFSEVSTFRPEDDAVGVAVRTLRSLGTAPGLRAEAPAEVVAAGLVDLVERYVALYRPGDELRRFLEGQVGVVRGSALPVVFQHGDPGTWNLLVRPDGITVLDWENGERHGLPLLDLFFLVQAVVLRAADRAGRRPTPEALARLLFRRSSWGRWMAEVAGAGAADLGLPSSFVEPLFHLSWVYQAVKEAPRLREGDAASGVASRTLQLAMAASVAGELPFDA